MLADTSKRPPTKERTDTKTVIAEIELTTHAALGKEAARIELATDERPRLRDVAARILNEWAAAQPSSTEIAPAG